MAMPAVRLRGRHGAVVASSLTVAVIVLGIASVKLGDTTKASPPTTAELSAGTDEPILDLDLGPLTGPPAGSVCTAPDVDAGSPEVELLYGMRQKSASGSGPVLLLRDGAGDLLMCDVAGPDRPAQLPLPQASSAEPVVFLTNGRSRWECTGETLDRYTSTTWLAVTPDVDRVQQRFVVDGAPGPWFTTHAAGGYAHLQTWLDGPVAGDTRLSTEYRVLDAAGEPVRQSALESAADLPGGCSDGGDVTIG